MTEAPMPVRLVSALVLVLTGLVVFATLAALLEPGSVGTTLQVTTVRGETALFMGSGLYRYDPVAVAREALVWDTINLVAGIPALLVAFVAMRRGDRRGILALAGLSAYFLYVYLMYATMSALNGVFPVYVAIAAVAATLLALLLAVVAARITTFAPRRRLPVRFLGGYLGAVALLLTALWSVRIAAVLGSGVFPPGLAGMTTLETQAMDLALVVPLHAGAAVLLLRRHPWGIPLSGIALTFGLLLDLAIPAWIASGLLHDGATPLLEVVPFFALSVAGALMLWRYLRSVGA